MINSPQQKQQIAQLSSQFNIPDWAEWVAQDRDGSWWAYQAEPNQQHSGWYENEVGKSVKLGLTAQPEDWREMLFSVDKD